MKLFIIPLIAATTVFALVADPPVAELSNLTATAVLAWYAWHTATRTVPKLVDDFRQELHAERTGHRADLDSFLHELATERAQRHGDNASIVHAVGELSAAISRFNSPKSSR